MQKFVFKCVFSSFWVFFSMTKGMVNASSASYYADIPSLVSHNDVIYLAPAREGWKGLPLGNGRMGTQVWQQDGMMFQFNTPYSGVYGRGSLCQCRIDTSPTMLSGIKTYSQRLSLYDAKVTTDIKSDSGNIQATCFIPADDNALIVQFQDTRSDVNLRFVELKTWRTNAVLKAEKDIIILKDTFSSPGGGEPPCWFAVAVGFEGAEAVTSQRLVSSARLQTSSKQFTAWIAVAESREANADVEDLARQKLQALRNKGLDAIRKTHAQWWAGFWNKSFISLRSDDGVADYAANLWYLHLYAMGAGSRGELPPKFNGGFWITGPEEREWGGQYWHWNTQECYWPIFAANHLELLKPYLDLYWNMLPKVKKWTKESWELDGAQYQETIYYTGMSYNFEKVRGAHPRVPIPKSPGYTPLILSSSAEIAMQFWWYYLYTGDETFLRDRIYPLLKEITVFYLGYLEKDAKGNYIMCPSNAHETFWAVKNPATDLAALRFLFPVMIEICKKLNVDAELRALCQDRLDHLAPYPINPKTGAILPYEPRPDEKVESKNGENPDLFPIGVFPLLTLDSPEYNLALTTFHCRIYVTGYGWNTDLIAAARLGLAESSPPEATPQYLGLPQLIVQHIKHYQGYPAGLMDFYERNPPRFYKHFYLEGSGTFATAINEMLLQSWNKRIRIFPALPKAWSADFKLLAMGGFEVTARAEKGAVKYVALHSQRGETADVVNPYNGSVVVTCNGKQVLKSDSPALSFPTKAGETYVILRTGDALPQYTITAEPNQAPKRFPSSSRNWIGIPESNSLTMKPPVETNAPKPPPLTQIDRPANPAVKPARFAAAPVLDGDLSDEIWKGAASLGPFFVLGQKTPAIEQTDVLMGFDDKSLYFGITCWESRMGEMLAAKRDIRFNHDDADILNDDVEIYLLPRGYSTVWHFAVNASGARYDARGYQTVSNGDRRFNPLWQAGVTNRSNRWIAEIAIPFESISPELPQSGEEWGFDICRNEQQRNESSTWAPLTSAMLLKDFGRICFDKGFPVVQETIKDPGLVGHWRGDDIRGSWIRDSSGHRHHGCITAPMTSVAGKTGKALDFTGTNFVDIADAPDLNPTNSLTLAVWVLPKKTAAMRIIDKGLAGASDAYMLDTLPENNVRFIVRPTTVSTKETLPVDQWSHVAVTCDNKTIKIYINGQIKAESSSLNGTLNASPLPLRLGVDSQGASLFSGLMDDVRIYQKALKQEEITNLISQKE